MILGGGPNRIGQGIEFDYCCCHASFALRRRGDRDDHGQLQPGDGLTDYDTSDRLYFEPLTLEDVLHIVDAERPEGAIVQFGGQTPLRLALALQEAGVKILGTSPDSIDLAEDRDRFGKLLRGAGDSGSRLGHRTLAGRGARDRPRVGYPVLVRPSYVLGGSLDVHHPRRRDAGRDDAPGDGGLTGSLGAARSLSWRTRSRSTSTRISDGERRGRRRDHAAHRGGRRALGGLGLCHAAVSWVGRDRRLGTLRDYTHRLAKALKRARVDERAVRDQGRRGLRARGQPAGQPHRSVRGQGHGCAVAKLAARVMVGRTLDELGLTEEPPLRGYFVKESVLPFSRFPDEDPILGPEMRSTGEVMGIAPDFGTAFAKAQLGAGMRIPLSGQAFLSVNDNDKDGLVPIAKGLAELGFTLVATRGTAGTPAALGLQCADVFKVNEGRPHVVDLMKNGEIDLIINTPLGRGIPTSTKSDAHRGDATRRSAGDHAFRRARHGPAIGGCNARACNALEVARCRRPTRPSPRSAPLSSGFCLRMMSRVEWVLASPTMATRAPTSRATSAASGTVSAV